MIDTISKHAPLITLPWLSTGGTLTHKELDKSTADSCLDSPSVKCNPAQPKPESTVSDLTSTSIDTIIGSNSPLTGTSDKQVKQDDKDRKNRVLSSVDGSIDDGSCNPVTKHVSLDKGSSSNEFEDQKKPIRTVSDSRYISVYSPLHVKKTIVKSKKRKGPAKRGV